MMDSVKIGCLVVLVTDVERNVGPGLAILVELLHTARGFPISGSSELQRRKRTERDNNKESRMH